MDSIFRCALVAAWTSACAGAGAVRYQALAGEISEPPRADSALFTGAAFLSHQDLVAAVWVRNPTLIAARAAARAALARYDRDTALDDPRVAYELAPRSIGARDMPLGQTVRIEQMLPLAGQLGLRGRVALAEAEMAAADLATLREELALMAYELYADYFVAARALTKNAEHQVLVERIAASAAGQYAAGQASQQEPLAAEIELAQLARQRIELNAGRAVILARLNGLLHRAPLESLPPPPADLREPTPLPSQDDPLATRPELRAAEGGIEGASARVDLAGRSYVPDLGLMASYSTMWADPRHRFMAGVTLSLPLQLGARSASVREAEAALAAARATRDGRIDDVRVEVETARVRIAETRGLLDLYRTRLVPAAAAQIEAARIAYQNGRAGFQALLDAERTLRSVELDYEVTQADLLRRHARYLRAAGTQSGGKP